MNILKCLIVTCLLLSSNKCSCFSVFKNLKKEILHAKVDTKNDINKQKVVLDVKDQYKVSSNNSESFIPAATKFTTFEKCKPCAKNVKCVPPIQCPAHLRMTKHPQLCDLPGGGSKHGLCCSTGQNHTTKDYFKKHSKDRVNNHHLLQTAVHDARAEMKTLMHQEMNHKMIPNKARENHEPDFFHHNVFGNHRPADTLEISSISHRGVEQMMASRIFKDMERITVEESQLNNFGADFQGSSLEKTCPMRPSCPAKLSPYRTYDGTCNHLLGKETWGAAKTPMERLLPPAYEDGIWSPRATASDGSPLTNARKISRILFPDHDRPHPFLNLMVMQFGQFLSHDFTQSSSITLPDGKRVRCCSDDGTSILPAHLTHFACMSIPIENNDPFYSMFGQRCMNFVRLSIAPDHDCKLGYAKTLSKVTHYIDGSAIYGSDMKTQSELRSFQHGQLKMFMDFNRQLLPLNPNSEDCLVSGSACFMAGDVRVNQHITLVALHLLFAREHNRIAEELHHLNPHWLDDLLFEEARRIVVAEIQHITYNEWLPLVIGSQAVERFSLLSNPHGFSADYDEETNPSMTNEFTGAAFRFGHSTVQGKLFVEKDQHLDEVILVSDTFNNPGKFRLRYFYDEIMNTLTHEPMQAVDNSVTRGLSRFLFKGGQPFGLDLISLNIQRGRDEALRPYNEYLDVSGHKVVTSFDDFGELIGQKLSEVYRHPDDIDLFVGGLLESADADGIVGPTFREIIADQFSRLKRGDRYFYENHPEINPGAFNKNQLEEIKKISLARIICDNSDRIALSHQSPHAFMQSHLAGNEPIVCDSSESSGINLLLWKDQ